MWPMPLIGATVRSRARTAFGATRPTATDHHCVLPSLVGKVPGEAQSAKTGGWGLPTPTVRSGQSDHRQYGQPEQRQEPEARAGAAHLRIGLRVADGIDDPAYHPSYSQPERNLSAVKDRCDPQQRNEDDEIFDRVDMRAVGALELRMADNGRRLDLVFAPEKARPSSHRQGKKTAEDGIDGSKIIGK